MSPISKRLCPSRDRRDRRVHVAAVAQQRRSAPRDSARVPIAMTKSSQVVDGVAGDRDDAIAGRGCRPAPRVNPASRRRRPTADPRRRHLGALLQHDRRQDHDASSRFITGPMISTWNRSHLVFDRNSSGAPVAARLGLSPAIFT